MRTRATILATLLGVACDAPVAAPSAPVQQGPSPRFVAGEVLVHRFAWRIDATIDGASTVGTAIDVDIDLAGELVLRVVEATDEMTILGLTIRRLDRHAIELLGADVLASAAHQLVGREHYLELDADGEISRARLLSDTTPIERHVIDGLVAHLDLRAVRDGATWRATVPTGNGLGDVDYTRTDEGVTRTLLGYTRLDAAASGSTPEVNGHGTLHFDARGAVDSITSNETLRMPVQGEDTAFASHTTFTLQRIAVERGVAGGMPGGLVDRDPTAPPDDAEAQRELARRFAGDLSLDDIDLTVAGVGNGVMPPDGFIAAATGLLRGWPEHTDTVAAMFETNDGRFARGFVIDMLASAGTPQAQLAMVRLLEPVELRDEPGYASWLQRFSFLAAPEPEIVGLLLDVHADAESRADAQLRDASLYPLGSVATSVRDPWLAALAQRRVVDALEHAEDDDARAAAIAGLGNGGAPESLELLLAFADDLAPRVRAKVASALRRHDDARAIATLLDLLDDPHDGVAKIALGSLSREPLGPLVARDLAEAIAAGRYHPAIEGDVIGGLARRRDDAPAVAEVLTRLAATASDPVTRARARAAAG